MCWIICVLLRNVSLVQLACDHLRRAQGSMKARFDKKSVVRNFAPGEKVLVLLPVTVSSLRAQFSGPYEVDRKISDTNCVIKMPDRKRKLQVCHVNMLTCYVSKELATGDVICSVVPSSVSAGPAEYHPQDDSLMEKSGCILGAWRWELRDVGHFGVLPLSFATPCS